MTPRDLLFGAFWLFVAISASYVAFQMADSAGLWVGISQSIAGLVFGIVVLTAIKRSCSDAG
jgi:membrane associated rhomboid family serine protease